MSKVGQVPNQNGQQPSPTTIPEPNDKESNPQLKTTRRIVLAPNSNPEVNQVFDLLDGQGKTAPYSLAADPSPIDGNTATTDVQPAVAIVVDTMLNGPGAGGGPTPRFFAISDPPTTQGYFANGEQAVALVGSAEGELKFSTIQDTPVDMQTAIGGDPTMMSNQTTLGYRTVHLQRLADPTLPYNPPPTDPYAGPVNNPKLPVNVYLTVDSASIDVTSFNGVWPASVSVEPGAGTQAVTFCSAQAAIRATVAVRSINSTCCGRTAAAWISGVGGNRWRTDGARHASGRGRHSRWARNELLGRCGHAALLQLDPPQFVGLSEPALWKLLHPDRRRASLTGHPDQGLCRIAAGQSRGRSAEPAGPALAELEQSAVRHATGIGAGSQKPIGPAALGLFRDAPRGRRLDLPVRRDSALWAGRVAGSRHSPVLRASDQLLRRGQSHRNATIRQPKRAGCPQSLPVAGIRADPFEIRGHRNGPRALDHEHERLYQRHADSFEYDLVDDDDGRLGDRDGGLGQPSDRTQRRQPALEHEKQLDRRSELERCRRPIRHGLDAVRHARPAPL